MISTCLDCLLLIWEHKGLVLATEALSTVCVGEGLGGKEARRLEVTAVVCGVTHVALL